MPEIIRRIDFFFLTIPYADLQWYDIIKGEDEPVFKKVLVDCQIPHVKSGFRKSLYGRDTGQGSGISELRKKFQSRGEVSYAGFTHDLNVPVPVFLIEGLDDIQLNRIFL